MSADPIAAGLQQAIEASVDDAWTPDGEHPNTVVTRWLVIAEVACDDGTMRLHRDYSEGCQTWHAIGMLRLVEDELATNFNQKRE